jgi:hypothetical protein
MSTPSRFAYEGCHPAEHLRLRDHLQRQRGLARGLGPEHLDDAAAGDAADAEGVVDADGTGGDGGNRGDGLLLAQTHDRPLAELLLDLSDGSLDGTGAFTHIVCGHAGSFCPHRPRNRGRAHERASCASEAEF